MKARTIETIIENPIAEGNTVRLPKGAVYRLWDPSGVTEVVTTDELVIEPTSAYDGFEGTDEDGQPWAVPPTLGWGTDAGRAVVELTAALLEANGY